MKHKVKLLLSCSRFSRLFASPSVSLHSISLVCRFPRENEERKILMRANGENSPDKCPRRKPANKAFTFQKAVGKTQQSNAKEAEEG